jgi:Flp pilus assembly protein TadG
MTMHRGRSQRGTAFAYLGVTLFALVGFTGLAVDLGRSYVTKSNLSKAVDAAALAAARTIGQGQSAARDEANKIFNVNFPNGYLGVTSVQNPPLIDFSVAADDSNVITVSSRAVLPTTFMRVAGFRDINVAASGQATRRLVDLAFIVDHSGSLSSEYDAVKSAAQQFVSYFDPDKDRVALVMFATSTVIMDPINTGGHGFDKSSLLNHIGGDGIAFVSTATAEGLYAGWDQLRSVSSGSQAGLRVVVLFTDGAPNTFSGQFSVKPCHGCSGALVPTTGALFTSDYRLASGDKPEVRGLGTIYGTPSDTSLHYVSPTNSNYTSGTNSNTLVVNPDIPGLPLASLHPTHSSWGIPTGFNLYDSSLPGQRVLVGGTGSGYPDHVQNANNAARNLAEIIANAARADTSGSSPIRIYTLGLGDLLNQNGGSVPETGTSILMRIANDPASPSFNPSQAEGKYYFAGDTSQLASAFEAIRNQIIRLSQ